MAIVVTLVFLIIEIRGNSAAIRAATATSISDRTNSMLVTNSSNLALMEAVLRQSRGEELTPLDELLLGRSDAGNLKLAEESFIAFRQGNLEEEVWLTRLEFVLDMLASEHGRARWAVRRETGWYVQGFVDYMDAELARRYGE